MKAKKAPKKIPKPVPVCDHKNKRPVGLRWDQSIIWFCPDCPPKEAGKTKGRVLPKVLDIDPPME